MNTQNLFLIGWHQSCIKGHLHCTDVYIHCGYSKYVVLLRLSGWLGPFSSSSRCISREDRDVIRPHDNQADTGASLIQIRLTAQVLKMQVVADKKHEMTTIRASVWGWNYQQPPDVSMYDIQRSLLHLIVTTVEGKRKERRREMSMG